MNEKIKVFNKKIFKNIKRNFKIVEIIDKKDKTSTDICLKAVISDICLRTIHKSNKNIIFTIIKIPFQSLKNYLLFSYYLILCSSI